MVPVIPPTMLAPQALTVRPPAVIVRPPVVTVNPVAAVQAPGRVPPDGRLTTTAPVVGGDVTGLPVPVTEVTPEVTVCQERVPEPFDCKNCPLLPELPGQV